MREPRGRGLAISGTAHPVPDHLCALAGHAEVCAVHPGRYRPDICLRHAELPGVPGVTDAASALAHAQLAPVWPTRWRARVLDVVAEAVV
ncbi:hypothetical protein QFZ22_004679 [Streptomyces canus]|uniref:Uncharacterized protein n=1 Tax=Streptomyces canus TaxID=58343 RepID=A0AAW8FG49_9ACTN|nr:hypothetical protein [Streptomyces canus]MDQ0908694.1 hypothetical protein [Streptomyces canus]